MGKSYQTCDMQKIFDIHLDRMVRQAVDDRTVSGNELVAIIKVSLTLRRFADEIIADMKEQDMEYEMEGKTDGQTA